MYLTSIGTVKQSRHCHFDFIFTKQHAKLLGRKQASKTGNHLQHVLVILSLAVACPGKVCILHENLWQHPTGAL